MNQQFCVLRRIDIPGGIKEQVACGSDDKPLKWDSWAGASRYATMNGGIVKRTAEVDAAVMYPDLILIEG